jgi:hypothetical protein
MLAFTALFCCKIRRQPERDSARSVNKGHVHIDRHAKFTIIRPLRFHRMNASQVHVGFGAEIYLICMNLRS